jgi:hypothetical protein
MKTISYRRYVSALGLLAAFLVTDGLMDGYFIPSGSIVSSAEARMGRPLTPGSVAGVARRTTRRVVRRSTIYVAALPASCATVSVNGMRLWQCGGAYYQSSGGRYVVVYVN